MIFRIIKNLFFRHHRSFNNKTKPADRPIENVKYSQSSAEDDIDVDEEPEEERRCTDDAVINMDVIRPEKRTTKQLVIEKKIADYVDSFTIHGLTKSVKGKKIESLFWSLMLTVGTLCVSVVIYGLITKYYSHAVYTELISKITDKNYFPSITICEKSLLQQAYFSYCGSPISNYKEKPMAICPQHFPYKQEQNRYKETWGTSLFQVTNCITLGSKPCNGSDYWRSQGKLNNSCITWNYKGDIYDPYSYVNITFEFTKPDHLGEVEMYVMPHDHRITEIDLTKKVSIDADHKYEIKIDKTFIKRLPAPFPSNCTNEQTQDIFPGSYTRFSCIESYYYIDMYKRCGDVFDYHKPYIPTDIVERYKRNSTNVTKCIVDFTLQELRNLRHCQFACDMLDLDYYATFQMRHGRKRMPTNVYQYQVGVQLKTANEYRVMEEKQLYSLSQMACEIGGFVGLVMGMSVISIIEVLVIVALTILKKVIRVQNRYY